MTGAVYVKTYPPPEYDAGEILRYAGVPSPSPEITALMESCREELEGRLAYQVCYAEFPVSDRGGCLDLGFARTASADLRRNLKNCGGVVLFAATVGLELDRLIARHGLLSPARAVMLQAIGAERIEALCGLFCEETAREKELLGLGTRPRFSPGYGDLPIELQRDIFRALDCPRKIGLTLNGSLLMSPSKSVTAIVGIGEGAAERQKGPGCEGCAMRECQFRGTI